MVKEGYAQIPRYVDNPHNGGDPRLFSVDRVMQGRVFNSQASLFCLPIECLSQILQEFHSRANGKWRASLALVNSDCRQLARSLQFRISSFDLKHYYYSRPLILQKLLEEAAQPPLNPNEIFSKNSNLPLGPCIQAFAFTDIENEEIQLLLQRIHTILPNLAHVRMYNGNHSPSIYNSIFAPTVTYCELSLSQFRGATGPFPSTQLPESTLRRLKLVDNSTTAERGTPINASLSSLLSHCAPNLESLCVKDGQANFEGMHWHRLPVTFLTSTNTAPRFNKLQQLTVGNASCAHRDSWLSLFAAPLKFMRLDHLCGHDPLLVRCLAERGRIPTLESFWWKPCCYSSLIHVPTDGEFQERLSKVSEGFLSFLAANKQLTKFMVTSITENIYQASMKKIFPILQSFTALKSLSLTWTECHNIPGSALVAIASIGSLEQLHLGLDNAGLKCYSCWQVNHETIRAHLVHLQKLRRIAFQQDTYDSDGFAYPNHNDITPKIESFREKHLHRMCQEADQYLQLLPKLGWMFIGKRSLVVAKDENGKLGFHIVYADDHIIINPSTDSENDFSAGHWGWL